MTSLPAPGGDGVVALQAAQPVRAGAAGDDVVERVAVAAGAGGAGEDEVLEARAERPGNRALDGVGAR